MAGEGREELGSDEWRAVLDAAAEALGWEGPPPLIEGRTRGYARETRLKFNAPGPVDAWRLEAVVTAPDGSRKLLDIEALFWLHDAVWEVWHIEAADA